MAKKSDAPEQISADELAYLQSVQQQLQAAQEQVQTAQAAWQSFSAYLVQKYGLTPSDGLRPDGAIVRDVEATTEATTP